MFELEGIVLISWSYASLLPVGKLKLRGRAFRVRGRAGPRPRPLGLLAASFPPLPPSCHVCLGDPVAVAECEEHSGLTAGSKVLGSGSSLIGLRIAALPFLLITFLKWGAMALGEISGTPHRNVTSCSTHLGALREGRRCTGG